VLELVDAYITPELDLGDFEKNLLDSFKYKNHIFGLPKDYSTLALFYNKKAFTLAGLTHPPTTWEELCRYSQHLTGKFNKYGFGVIPKLARQAYKIKAFGGQVVDQNSYATFANPVGLQGLQPVVDQYQKDKSSAQASDVGASSGSEMFGQNQVAMVIEGNWAIPYLKETFPQIDFATAEVPKINHQKSTMVFTVAYVMNRQSQNKAADWELISYLTGKEGMEKWAKGGMALPSRRSVATQLGYDQDPLRMPLVAGANYAMPWQAGKYPNVIINSFENQFLSAMLGEQSLQQAMLQAQEGANRQIQGMEE